MSTPSEPSVFGALFQAACKEYGDRTGKNLAEHPLAIQLQACHSFESLVTLIQEQARAFREFRISHDKVTISLNHTSVCHLRPCLSDCIGPGWGIRWTRQQPV
jgi:hypothetical protein